MDENRSVSHDTTSLTGAWFMGRPLELLKYRDISYDSDGRMSLRIARESELAETVAFPMI